MGEYRMAQVIQQTTNPTKPMVDAVISAANAHPAWEYVGGFRVDGDGGTSAYRNYIFKNLGSLNSFGQDFYVFLTTADEVAVGATTLYATVCEQIQVHPTIPTARQAIRVVPTFSNASLTPTSGTHAYMDTPISLTNGTQSGSFNTNTSTYNYRLLLTNNVMFLVVDTQDPSYLGLFEPLWAHANEFPLVHSKCNTRGSYTDGSFSRSPGQTASLGSCFSAQIAPYTATMGRIGDPATNLRPGVVGTRALLLRNGAEGQNGKERGLLYDTLMFSTLATITPGDTITTPDGKVYENFGVSGGYFTWFNKSAP